MDCRFEEFVWYILRLKDFFCFKNCVLLEMVVLILFVGVVFFSDGGFCEDLFLCRRYVNVFKYFDFKLLFFGLGNGFLKLC